MVRTAKRRFPVTLLGSKAWITSTLGKHLKRHCIHQSHGRSDNPHDPLSSHHGPKSRRGGAIYAQRDNTATTPLLLLRLLGCDNANVPDLQHILCKEAMSIGQWRTL